MRVVDLSASGARVDGDARVPPGATVELRLQGATAAVVRARVVRCQVSALIGEGTIRYAAGLEFATLLDVESPLARPGPEALTAG